jgi:hypothetical protein
MAIALILLSLLHALGVAAAFVLGWVSGGLLELHLYLAIGVVALGLFTHSMVLFYFIGTGKVLKDAVARFGLGPEIPRRLRAFKVQTSGPLTLACAALITTSALGARTLVGGPAAAHFWVGLATVLLNGWVVAREVRCIAHNVRLFHELADRVGPLEPEAHAEPAASA